MQNILIEKVIKRVADRLDQLVLIGLFIMLCFRLMPDGQLPEEAYVLMILLSESIVILFVLIRRSTDKISLSFYDWFIALAGTMTVLLIGPVGKAFMPEFGVGLILLGFTIHFGAKLSLRRSFGIVPADRGIKSNGLYAIVRHPMYMGYFVSHMGYLIAAPSVRNALVYVVAWGFFIMRIFAEEKLLGQNTDYQAYRQKVKYRFIPFVL